MWFILALLTAFFTSLQDVLGKKIVHKVDVYIISWGWMFFSLPFLYVYLFVQGIPPIGPHFAIALSVSAVILIFASVLYFKAIKHSDLSVTMPMLTFTPLFLLVTSPMILGEFPGWLGVVGILLIVSGSYVLYFQYRRKGYWEPFKKLLREKGPRYMLVVALIYSVGANLDKIGVLNSSPLMWIAALNTVIAGAIWIIMQFKVKDIKAQIISVWPILLLIGLCHAISMIFQMTAITMTLVPYLIAVKRTSVVMTSILGFLFFKEKGMKERLIGAALMILGVFIISFYQ